MKAALEVFGVSVVHEGIAEGGTSRIHRGVIESPDSPLGPRGRSLAIKEYKASVLDVPGQRERIRQEATLTSRINHPTLSGPWGWYQMNLPVRSCTFWSGSTARLFRPGTEQRQAETGRSYDPWPLAFSMR
jgi:hypothetical protein